MQISLAELLTSLSQLATLRLFDLFKNNANWSENDRFKF